MTEAAPAQPSGRPLACGVDVGGTKILGGVVDADGTVVEELRVESPATDTDAIVDAIAGLVTRLAARHRITAVGVGAAGYIDKSRSVVMFAPNIAWRDVPLRARLEARTELPVVIENDANAAAWGEFAYGAGHDVDDLLLVTVGTGVGGGVVLDGELYRGAFGVGAEIGHMRVVPDGHLCGCGNRGCLEQYAAGRALVREAQAAARSGDPAAAELLTRAGGVVDAITGPLVTTAARDGDPFAVGQLATLGRWLGEGIASLTAVLDPAVVVIGGGVSEAGDLLVEPARAGFLAQLTGRGHRPVAEIRRARLGNRAGLIGAADLARRRREPPRRRRAIGSMVVSEPLVRRPRMWDPLTVGIDIGGTKVLAGVVDAYGKIVEQQKTATIGHDVTVVEDTIVDLVTYFASHYDVAAVGIGAAGFVDASRSTVTFSPHLAWRDEPLRARVAQRVRLPVVVDNDANTTALGESRFGAGAGRRFALCTTLGTGIGGALVIDGRVFRGANGMAGEFGHMQVVEDGHRCPCGNRGCWEQYASGNALEREARELVAHNSPMAHHLRRVCGGDPHRLSGPQVTQAAQDGDPLSIELLADVGRWLGVGLANLVAAFDPSCIIVGGGVSDAGDLLLTPTRAAMIRSLVGRGHRAEPPVLAAQLGPAAGFIGAADMARSAARRSRRADRRRERAGGRPRGEGWFARRA